MEILVEAAAGTDPARTRKGKSTKGRPRKPKAAAYLEEPLLEAAPKPKDDEKGTVYGWPIKDGFARIMIFSDPGETKVTYITTTLGDHPRVQLAKRVMHVLPMGLVNNIIDTTQTFPVDDLEDEMRPKRYFESRARFPHSEPIPATAEEYVAYRKAQEKLPHPNSLKKVT